LNAPVAERLWVSCLFGTASQRGGIKPCHLRGQYPTRDLVYSRTWYVEPHASTRIEKKSGKHLRRPTGNAERVWGILVRSEGRNSTPIRGCVAVLPDGKNQSTTGELPKEGGGGGWVGGCFC